MSVARQLEEAETGRQMSIAIGRFIAGADTEGQPASVRKQLPALERKGWIVLRGGLWQYTDDGRMALAT